MAKFNRQQWSKAWLTLGVAGEIGWTIAGPVVFFTLVGDFLDKSLGSQFVFRFLGGILGIGVAMYLIYKKAESLKKKVGIKSPSDNPPTPSDRGFKK